MAIVITLKDAYRMSMKTMRDYEESWRLYLQKEFDELADEEE